MGRKTRGKLYKSELVSRNLSVPNVPPA